MEKKVCSVLDAGNQRVGMEGGHLSKGRLSPLTLGARAFIERRRWLRAETAQSALTVVWKLVMQWSDQHPLDCFK